MASIEVTEFTDPGCPWAYSASPALAALQWRYRDQLRWRIVAIGLTEDPAALRRRRLHARRAMSAGSSTSAATGCPSRPLRGRAWPPPARACRAIVATRLLDPDASATSCGRCSSRGSPPRCSSTRTRTSPRALGAVRGLDARRVVAAIDDPATLEAYEQDRRETRTADGGATDFQGKAAPDRRAGALLGPFAGASRARPACALEAGGFQPLEAYDVLIANLDRSFERHAPPETPLEALARFPAGLVTREVAAIMAHNNVPPDRDAAERGAGRAARRGRRSSARARRRRALAAGVSSAGGARRAAA